MIDPRSKQSFLERAWTVKVAVKLIVVFTVFFFMGSPRNFGEGLILCCICVLIAALVDDLADPIIAEKCNKRFPPLK